MTRPSPVQDLRQRPLTDLRISVTDRCNFRCAYCMPREHFAPGTKFLPKSQLLSFEEIAYLGQIFAELGVTKFRLTGGEPLLRAELPRLVAQLSRISGTSTALTTNGALLGAQASALAQAGLTRVTVSLDALDDALFRRLNDVNVPVSDVLAGIEAAAQAGLRPLKVNMVVRRGVNDTAVLDMANYFRGSGHVLRFIEFMDVGSTNRWQADEVMSGQEILERVAARFPLRPLVAAAPGEVAKRWAYVDGQGEIGVITSMTRPFCGDCSRARLSADGRLFLCLFATHGLSLRDPLREGASREELRDLIAATWQGRSDRYSELRTQGPRRHLPVEMSYIGG